MEELFPEASFNNAGILSRTNSVYLPFSILNDSSKPKFIKIVRLTGTVVSLYLSLFSERVDGNTSNCEVLVYRHSSTGQNEIRGYTKTVSELVNSYTPLFYIDKANNDLYISLKEYMTSSVFIRAIKGSATSLEFDCKTIIDSVEGFTLLTNKMG